MRVVTRQHTMRYFLQVTGLLAQRSRGISIYQVLRQRSTKAIIKLHLLCEYHPVSQIYPL
jgi:hypothetical protein